MKNIITQHKMIQVKTIYKRTNTKWIIQNSL
jgi:hypothetical protein